LKTAREGVEGERTSAPTVVEEVKFASDSPLEGDGFELPVPREIGAGAPLSKRLWE